MEGTQPQTVDVKQGGAGKQPGAQTTLAGEMKAKKECVLFIFSFVEFGRPLSEIRPHGIMSYEHVPPSLQTGFSH